MSIRLMNLAFSADMPPTHKLVFIRICDYSNDTGVCWPSINQLALAGCISERQCQRIMRDLIAAGVLAVIGNEHGGKPGETRHYKVNEKAITLAVIKRKTGKGTGDILSPVRKQKKAGDTDDTGDNMSPVLNAHEEPEVIHTGDKMTPVTGDAGVTRVTDIRVTPMTQTGDTHVTPRVTPVTQTGDMGVTLTTIEPPINHHRTTISTEAESAPVIEGELVDDEDNLQTACKATWAAFSEAYQERYTVKPLRHAQVNANVKTFVQRVGHEDAPKVAAFYVWINDQFLIRNSHEFQYLTKNAGSYWTQWKTQKPVTATTARQQDRTQSNRSAAEEAKEIIRRRRENGDAYRSAVAEQAKDIHRQRKGGAK